MAGQLLQGGNVFEITDHTTASDWERFIASLEEILTEWNLNQQLGSDSTSPRELPPGFISSGLWHERHDLVKFANVTFDLRYQYLVEPKGPADTSQYHEDNETSADAASSEFHDASNEEEFRSIPKQKEKEHGEYELPKVMPECLVDLLSTNNDFASKAHCLVRWYNLRRFLMLTPCADTIVTEDRVNLILSSASIALSNISCQVPIFVKTHNPKNNFFQGISEYHNIRTMYEMMFYKQNLKQYEYISEVINVFREKTNCNLDDPISVSIRLNYCLDYFDLFMEPRDEFDGNEHSDEDDELVKLTTDKKPTQPIKQDLRSGASFEVVQEAMKDCLPHPYKILRYLHVAALWPPISDKVVTDSQVHSDLDPVEAPIWTIRCVTSDNCNMKIVHDTQVISQLLCAAVDYAYDKLDANEIFTNCSRQQLADECLQLSYQVATQPEVVLSRDPADNIRKLIALLFYRAAKLREDLDALDQIANQLKKNPSLSEIYRNFKRNRTSVKESIIRTQISRPFISKSSPALPQRIFCTVADNEFRICGAFSELCN